MSDELIDGYVHELKVSAWLRGLPATRTAALENETRARIAADLATAGSRDDATVYDVLDRMGPAADIVEKDGTTPPTGIRGAVAPAVTPFVRARFMLEARGWGAAEIGGLVLLIAGPFVLWWIGPIFGIILVRTAAARWSHRAEHVATNVVFSLLAVHALIAVALFALALIGGGPLADELQQVLSTVTPGTVGRTGFNPVAYTSGPMFVLAVVVALLPVVAGIASGIFLALSPRQRR